ncbi:MAG TPA: hypothetical protein VIZ28_03895 [Chitinophagaceae bacterium]
MQFKKTILRLFVFLFPSVAFSQTTYLPQGDKANILLERLEIKAQKDSVLNFSKIRPFSRKHSINGANSFVQHSGKNSLSKTDAYNLERLYLNNMEYLTAEDQVKYKSKKSILKHFYTSPANLYEVHVKDFDLVVNPFFQYTLSK